MLKSLADLKRLPVGTELKLVYSRMKNHKFLNVIRKIEIKQTNAIKFEGGSWLEYPAAVDLVIHSNWKSFDILEDKSEQQKMQDIVLEDILAGKYPETEEIKHSADFMVASPENGKRYLVPIADVNTAREKAKTYEEKQVILTYELV